MSASLWVLMPLPSSLPSWGGEALASRPTASPTPWPAGSCCFAPTKAEPLSATSLFHTLIHSVLASLCLRGLSM